MKKTLLAVLLLAGLGSFSMAQAVVFKKADLIKQELSPAVVPPFFVQTNKWRCENIAKAMENRISTFEKRQNYHVPAYDNLKSRLDTLVSKLDSRGYDVDDLRTEVATLGNKIAKLKSDYDVFLNKLNEIKNYADACTDYKKADVQTKLAEARALLKTIRNEDNDIRSYFKTVIRPDIAQIKKQKPTN